MPKALALAACAVLAASLAVVAVATFAGDDPPAEKRADNRPAADAAATDQTQAGDKRASGKKDDDDCCGGGGEESGVRSFKKPDGVATGTQAGRSEHSHGADAGGGEEPEETDEEAEQAAWKAIAEVMAVEGVLKDGVYTFTFPRDDLEITVDGWDVPAGAGLESQFRFYRCPCGKMLVMGQYCVADYEANDVLDALRQGHVTVASVGPMLLFERPEQLMLIRFQGEGKAGELAKTLKSALEWMGEARMAPQKIEPFEESR
jgi:hypothetical protein